MSEVFWRQGNWDNCTDDVSQATAIKPAAGQANLFSSREKLYVTKCCSTRKNVSLRFEIIKPRVCRAAPLLHHTTHRTSLWDKTCCPLRGKVWLSSLLPPSTHQCRYEALNKTNFTAFCMHLLQAGQKKGTFLLVGLQAVQSPLGVATHLNHGTDVWSKHWLSDFSVQNSPHSEAHAGKIYTIAATASTLDIGDPAFSGVQPAWEEGTIPVKGNSLLPCTCGGETPPESLQSGINVTAYQIRNKTFYLPGYTQSIPSAEQAAS